MIERRKPLSGPMRSTHAPPSLAPPESEREPRANKLRDLAAAPPPPLFLCCHRLHSALHTRCAQHEGRQSSSPPLAAWLPDNRDQEDAVGWRPQMAPSGDGGGQGEHTKEKSRPSLAITSRDETTMTTTTMQHNHLYRHDAHHNHPYQAENYHHHHHHDQLIIYNYNNRQHPDDDDDGDDDTRASRAWRHAHFHHHPRKWTPTTESRTAATCRLLSSALVLALTLHLLQIASVLARVDDQDNNQYNEGSPARWLGDQAEQLDSPVELFEEFAVAADHRRHYHRPHHETPLPPPSSMQAVNPQAAEAASSNTVVVGESQSSNTKHRYGNRNARSEQRPLPPARKLSTAGRRRLAQAAVAAATAGQRSKRHNGGLNLGPPNGQPLLPSFQDNAADRPVVATSKGLVKGITQKIFTGKFVDAFLGIPFGQPPRGKYRFRHPQPVQPWQGELDASRMSNSCYQVNDTFFGANFGGTSIWNANTPLNEDCLQLNIWTPFATANTVLSTGNSGRAVTGDNTSGKSANKSNRGPGRPVLVWIFGGGFYSGTPTLSLYEGGAMASEEDLIVVSINYRVSALGFLYFGRPEAPGNAGLFDQLLALQWIQDEIGQFGGDPRRVTIFGESAGAVSVAFHLLSPLSRNLFSQAILQSGAATCPWGHMEAREIMANGFQLAATLGCPVANSSNVDAVIECLLRAHPMALVSQEVGQTQSSVINFPFVPVVDGAFLLEPPAESLAKGNFKPARLLLGSNNDEGNSWLIYMPEFSHCPGGSTTPTPAPPGAPVGNVTRESQPEVRQHQELDELVGVVRRSLLPVEPSKQQQQQQVDLQAVQYQQNESKPCKPNEDLQMTREDFIRLLREDLNPYAEHPLGKRAIVFEYSNWVNPLDPVSNYDALDKIVGDYYFTCHVNEFGLRYAQEGNPVYMYYFKQRSSISPWPKWMGVIHADEINFVFGEPLNPAFNYTKREVDLSRRMMKYWANFARFGNPTPVSQLQQYGNLTVTGSDQWPEYLPDRRQYFELHGEYIRVGRGPRAKQCAFWSHYLPRLLQTYGKNNQCHPKFTSKLNLKSPFISGRTGSYDDDDENTSNCQQDDDGDDDDAVAMSLHRPRQARSKGGLLTSIPSFILLSLIVIALLVALVLVAATGHSFYLAKGGLGRMQVPSWLAGLWPPWGRVRGDASASATTTTNNHDTDQAGDGGGEGSSPPRPPAGRAGNAAT